MQGHRHKQTKANCGPFYLSQRLIHIIIGKPMAPAMAAAINTMKKKANAAITAIGKNKINKIPKVILKQQF